MPAPTFPLCATPPTAGQVLIWDPINNEGCPADLSTLVAACPSDSQIIIWDAAMNDWVPANLCALVAACSPTCLPYIVYSNRRAIPAYSGPLYTLQRDSDSATMAFPPTGGGDADATAITAWLAGANGFATIWNDQSGNGYDGIEDFGVWDGNPRWTAAEVNGHPALQFTLFSGDTVARGLKAPAVTFPTASWTMFFVLKHDDYTLDVLYPDTLVTLSPLGINGGGADPTPQLITGFSTQQHTPPTGLDTDNFATDDFTNSNALASSQLAGVADIYGIIELAWNIDPTKVSAKYNGTDFPSVSDLGTDVGVDFAVSGDMGIGKANATFRGANIWLGWIAEIWIYNCVLSSAERDTRRADIAAYYGITLP